MKKQEDWKKAIKKLVKNSEKEKNVVSYLKWTFENQQGGFVERHLYGQLQCYSDQMLKIISGNEYGEFVGQTQDIFKRNYLSRKWKN